MGINMIVHNIPIPNAFIKVSSLFLYPNKDIIVNTHITNRIVLMSFCN